MIVSLTRRQMLDRWMLAKGFGPMRTDATVTRSDGLDLEAAMEADMRAWYLRILDTAPAPMLPLDTIAPRTTIAVISDTLAYLSPPADCRRIISLRLHGWHNDALIVGSSTPQARREDNPISRGGLWHPVAVLDPGGRISVRALPGGTCRIEHLVAVTDPGPDIYRFDESLFPEFQPLCP